MAFFDIRRATFCFTHLPKHTPVCSVHTLSSSIRSNCTTHQASTNEVATFDLATFGIMGLSESAFVHLLAFVHCAIVFVHSWVRGFVHVCSCIFLRLHLCVCAFKAFAVVVICCCCCCLLLLLVLSFVVVFCCCYLPSPPLPG